MEKHTKTCLKNRPNPIGEKLREWRNDFIALDNQKQSDILLEILKLTTFDNSGADLRAIGGKNQSGVSTIGKKISSQKSVVLVHRSVTGIFEKQVDLLSI
ncbi:Cas9 endonuclease PAM-interacting domain-containing protein [Pseudoramibacter alactolyticus]|uniref:Cas9 endonuclease PAM-interacting domain-containing protein n=1 Tax=Pseudoramibacter alactolyticus TaxID=113287 RepID=UPI003D7FDA30